MISRFPVFFLVLLSTVVFPWLFFLFKGEQQLSVLESASLEQETYLYDRVHDKSYNTPEDYVAAVSATGGDIAKAEVEAASAIKPWEVKNNTRAKARIKLLSLKRNVEGEPVHPVWKGGNILSGKRVYQAQGCFHCHTQQVRQKEFGVDIARGWGRRQSVARDYIYDSPVLLGISRVGPDLANVGTRMDAAALHKHIYRPPHGSNMPAYPFLYKVREIRGASSAKAIHFEEGEFGAPEEGFEVVPKPEAEYMVSYLLNLKQDYELPESRFYLDEDTADSAESGKATVDGNAGAKESHE